jgi:hypothetical protein
VFKTAGHEIGPSAADARVAVIIVSPQARASGAFLEAARRATDSGKAVVVTRIPLGAGRIEGAHVFDLTDWDGDPNAPVIDLLFSTIDLKLILARYDERGIPPVRADDAAPEATFAPPRVRAKPEAWKGSASTWFGAARAIGFIAILAGGLLSAGLAIGHREEARLMAAPPSEVHVAFADSVLNDASFDNIAPPAPPPSGVRGREPPSAPGLPR